MFYRFPYCWKRKSGGKIDSHSGGRRAGRTACDTYIHTYIFTLRKEPVVIPASSDQWLRLERRRSLWCVSALRERFSEPDEVGRMFRRMQERSSAHTKVWRKDVLKVTLNSLILVKHKLQNKSEWRKG